MNMKVLDINCDELHPIVLVSCFITPRSTDPRVSPGIVYHATENVLAILEATVTDVVPVPVFTALMMPFMVILTESPNKILLSRVHEYVITRWHAIVDHEIKAMQDDTLENSSGTKSVPAPAPDHEEEDVVLMTSKLQIYIPDLVAIMFDMASHPETREGNRKRLYNWVREMKLRYDIDLEEEDPCDEDDMSEEDEDDHGPTGDLSLDSDDDVDYPMDIASECSLDSDSEIPTLVEEASLHGADGSNGKSSESSLPEEDSETEEAISNDWVYLSDLLEQGETSDEMEDEGVTSLEVPVIPELPAVEDVRHPSILLTTRKSKGSKSVQWGEGNEVKQFKRVEPAQRIAETNVERADMLPEPPISPLGKVLKKARSSGKGKRNRPSNTPKLIPNIPPSSLPKSKRQKR
jgi:hypothetical protein